MMPRWTLAAAFAAGLLPGLLLYWSVLARPTPIAAPKPVFSFPASVPGAPGQPGSASPQPAAKPLERKTKSAAGDAENYEREARLRSDHQEALARAVSLEKGASEAQTKLREVEARLASLVEQQQSGQGQEKELRQQLDAAQRQAAALEASLKTREARLAELELAQQRLQRQGTETGQRQQRLVELLTELEENSRRRESYLNAILGRYREATELFRAMSLRLDNPRDVTSPLNNDLSRIQTAIQHADEDLRQLRTLNAQSARLQKELAARK